MNNDEKLLSWGEAFRINMRAHKLIRKKYPQMIYASMACMVWRALTPYVGIYLSAQVIEELMWSG